jgi:stage III sporulation protein AH
VFAVKRNQVVITALVVMIAVAGYLNYIETDKAKNNDGVAYERTEDERIAEALIDDATGQEVLIVNGEEGDSLFGGAIFNDGEAQPVDISADNPLDNSAITLEDVTAERIPDGSAESEPNDIGAAVFVNSSNDSSFFIQAKLEREQNRAKQRETLTGMIDNQNLEKSQKSEYAASMLEIQQRIEKESAAEALIEAKGFAEAYVRIDESTVDVIVSKPVLSDAEIAQIEDIVKRKTGVESTAIRVAPLKTER